MSNRSLKSLWTVFAIVGLGAGCGPGGSQDDDAASLDYVEPYRVACTQTVCQKEAGDCRARATQRCDDCYDSCSSPYSGNPALCASICHDICTGNGCTSCAAPSDQCAKQGIHFDPPPFNPELQLLAFRYLTRCEPDASQDFISDVVNFYGRSIRHEYAAVLECLVSKGCDAYAECDTFSTNGSIGTELCARQRACGAPCTESETLNTVAYVNAFESVLRPALVAQLARCAREADCGTAIECWAALKPALNLPQYETSP